MCVLLMHLPVPSHVCYINVFEDEFVYAGTKCAWQSTVCEICVLELYINVIPCESAPSKWTKVKLFHTSGPGLLSNQPKQTTPVSEALWGLVWPY